jgi:hypothetical protein
MKKGEGVIKYIKMLLSFKSHNTLKSNTPLKPYYNITLLLESIATSGT